MVGNRALMAPKESITIVPSPELPQWFWKGAWAVMEEDGAVGTIFYDGEIKTADDFASLMDSPGVHPFRITYGRQLASIMWLTHLEGRSCRGHFFVLSRFRRESRAIGSAMLRWLLTQRYEDGRHCFDVVIGNVPAWNMAAINVALRAGFKQSGVIPNGAWNHLEQRSFDMAILTATREHVCE